MNRDKNYISYLIQSLIDTGATPWEIRDFLWEVCGVEVNVVSTSTHTEMITECFHTEALGEFEINVN